MAWKLNPFTGNLDYYEVSTGGGGVPSNQLIKYTVNTYSDLAALSATIGEFAYVKNSQGTAWLPGTWGGTYYPRGYYFFNGTTWDNDLTDIAKELNDLNTTKLDIPTGTITDYLDGTGAVQPFPAVGTGDMTKAVYDPDNDGIVLSAQKEMVSVINKTGATIGKGSIVYLNSTSSSGTHPEILLADADTEATSSKTLGAVFEDIADSATGYVVTSGEVANLDTSSYAIGTKLWLSQTAGQVTSTPPVQPAHTVFIGTVTRSQTVNGRILYAIQNGYELNELHDVSLPSYTDKGVLYRDVATNLWKHDKISALLTLTTTGSSGAATLSGDTLNIPQYSGGLVYFTEAQNTSAPNATVYVDSFTSVSSTTDADVAIVPKGGGAFLLDIPNGSVSGGNKRGLNAIDLQSSRSGSTQVASGNYAITGGYGNTASGTAATAFGSENVASGLGASALGGFTNNSNGSYSSVGGGLSNIANNNYATVTGGRSNTAGGAYSTAGGYLNNITGVYAVGLGYNNTVSTEGAVAFGFSNSSTGICAVSLGQGNTASGTDSASLGRANASSGTSSIAIGYATTASGDYSIGMGLYANTFSQIGRFAFSSGRISTGGDIQKSFYILKGRSSSATPKTLTSDNATISAATIVSLQNNNVFRFKGSIVGKQNGSTNVAVWDIDGVIVRGVGVATTTLPIANVNVVTNASGWGTPTLTADTTNGGLTVNTIGAAATNIQWIANIETTEVIY